MEIRSLAYSPKRTFGFTYAYGNLHMTLRVQPEEGAYVNRALKAVFDTCFPGEDSVLNRFGGWRVSAKGPWPFRPTMQLSYSREPGGTSAITAALPEFYLRHLVESFCIEAKPTFEEHAKHTFEGLRETFGIPQRS